MDTSTVAEQLIKMPCNITWLSITQYEKLKDHTHYLATRVGNWNSKEESPSVVQFKVSRQSVHFVILIWNLVLYIFIFIQLEALIMDDVANHLAKALDMDELKDGAQPPTFSCADDAEPWAYGAAYQNKILEVIFHCIQFRIS